MVIVDGPRWVGFPMAARGPEARSYRLSIRHLDRQAVMNPILQIIPRGSDPMTLWLA